MPTPPTFESRLINKSHLEELLRKGIPGAPSITGDALDELKELLEAFTLLVIKFVAVSWSKQSESRKVQGKPGEPKVRTRHIMDAVAKVRRMLKMDSPGNGGQDDDSEDDEAA